MNSAPFQYALTALASIFVAYFLVGSSEKFKDTPIMEAFSNATNYKSEEEKDETKLSKLFKVFLDRKPNDYEKKIYKDMDEQKVTEHLTQSNEYKQSEAKYDAYRRVIETYNVTLDRMPNKYELDFYTERMLTKGSNFDSEDLRRILQASREYQIMQKNQTNVVQADLPGNITEQQITMDVRDTYASVYGNGAIPPKTMEPFLKQKYVEFSLDKSRLHKFIELIKATEQPTPSSSTKSTSSSGDSAAINSLIANLVSSSSSSSANANPSSFANTNKQQINNHYYLISPSDKDLKTLLKDIEENPSKYRDGSMNTIVDQEAMRKPNLKSCRPCDDRVDYTNYASYPYKDDLYAILKNVNNGNERVRGRICPKTYDLNNRDLYAEEVENRNMSELGYACARNTYFMNTVDEKILGTPLRDAEKTKVGSILPKFTYKELPRDYSDKGLMDF